MTELRLTGKSADGTHLTLVDTTDNEFTVRISDTLRATVNQPRLAAVVENDSETISVREIQARLRSGEPMETIARDARCEIEKIERFAGPILQERIYIIDLAQAVVMRKESGREPVTFSDVIISRLAPRQVDMNAVEWSTWRLEDGTWILRISYPNRDGIGTADWSFDVARKALVALDDDAKWMLGEEVAQVRNTDHGLVYGNHPTQTRTPEPTIGREGPRLVAIRETPDSEAAKDGVTGRAKVPSWDEIMFGSSKKNEEETEL